jgi:hypothetical protein
MTRGNSCKVGERAQTWNLDYKMQLLLLLLYATKTSPHGCNKAFRWCAFSEENINIQTFFSITKNSKKRILILRNFICVCKLINLISMGKYRNRSRFYTIWLLLIKIEEEDTLFFLLFFLSWPCYWRVKWFAVWNNKLRLRTLLFQVIKSVIR